MRINIQTLSFHASDKPNDFTKAKVSKLSQDSEQITEADVSLRVDRSGTRHDKFCQIRLAVPGYDLFASKQCQSFEEAILKTIEAFEQQLSHWKSNYQKISVNKEYCR